MVDTKVLRKHPKMAEVASGLKLSQEQFYVFYVMLMEIQKVLRKTLEKKGGKLSEEDRERLVLVSDHNFELIQFFFRQILRTGGAGEAVLGQKDSKKFVHHYNFLKKVFPFL